MTFFSLLHLFFVRKTWLLVRSRGHFYGHADKKGLFGLYEFKLSHCCKEDATISTKTAALNILHILHFLDIIYIKYNKILRNLLTSAEKFVSKEKEKAVQFDLGFFSESQSPIRLNTGLDVHYAFDQTHIIKPNRIFAEGAAIE